MIRSPRALTFSLCLLALGAMSCASAAPEEQSDAGMTSAPNDTGATGGNTGSLDTDTTSTSPEDTGDISSDDTAPSMDTENAMDTALMDTDTTSPDTAPGDPCDPNPCTMAPAPECSNGLTRVVFANQGMCTAQGDTASCSHPVAAEEDCSELGGSCVDGMCVGIAEAPMAGEVIITELMVDPSNELDDNAAEWIELHSIANDFRNLEGCALIDASNNSTPIGRIVIQPSGTLLFARSESGNGDIEPDALFDFGLNNDDESVILLCAGTIIDQVVYGSTFPIQPGYALSLDPGHTTADGNDQATNWCPSPDRYYEGNASPIGDHYGTPGRPNPACAPIDPSDPCDPNPCTTPPSPRCEGSTLITPQGPGTCSPMGDDASCLYPENTRDCTNEGRMCSASACIENTTTRAPTPGDLIVSEILYDPEGDLADGGSNNGEWVELYNTTRDTLMLDGCTVDDSNGNGTANLDGLMVPPDGYLVVGRGPGLPSLPDATFTFSLNNDDGDTVIVACGETIDSVSYGSGFPSADAASLNLNPDTLDATANDSGANWCPATEVYYMGNPAHLGTPGASNTPCDG